MNSGERRPMIEVFWGEDDYRIADAVRQVTSGGDPGLGDLNKATLDGARITPATLREQVESLPFLSDRRHIVVQKLLARFDGEGRGRGKTSSAGEFGAALAAAPTSAHVVFVEGQIDPKRNVLLPELIALGARVRGFPPLGPAELRGWIEQKVVAAGGTMTAPAMRLLIQVVGPDLWSLSSEIDKLLLFRSGQTVHEDDVRHLVSHARDENVFALVDAVVSGQGRNVLGRLGVLLEGGESPFGILALLQNRLRQSWLVRDGLDRGEPVAWTRQSAGASHLPDQVFERLLATARAWPSQRFADAHSKLLKLDHALKTGRSEPRLGLELLVLDLTSHAGKGA